MSVVDRLHRLAEDAARLALEISGEGDRVAALAAALRAAKLTVTHGGHRLLAEVGLGLAGPKPFAPEEVAVRVVDGALEFEPRDPLAWLAVTAPVAADRAALVTIEAELAEPGSLALFLRSRAGDAQAEGSRALAEGAARLSATRLLRPPPAVGEGVRTMLQAVLAPASGPIRLRLLAIREATDD